MILTQNDSGHLTNQDIVQWCPDVRIYTVHILGADQEHKTDEMHTALMEASMDGHVDVARLLLDHGAQVLYIYIHTSKQQQNF